MSRHRYSSRSLAAYAERLADRAAWHSGGAAERARLAFRAAVARSGLKVTPEFLELGCAPGNEASGLFSEFTAVLGCLDHYEQRREIYCGLRIDFEEQGLYYEPERGQNWWEYFFEPLTLGSPAGGRHRRVPLWQHDAFAESVEPRVPRQSAYGLIQRYVRARPIVLDAVDRIVATRFAAAHVIGVHYRGTDKYEEATPVKVKDVIEVVRAAASRGPESWKIFIATDDQPAFDAFTAAFPGRAVDAGARRSIDGRPVHKQPGDGFRKGLEACVDCWTLSRCAEIVRTSSNLGLVATYLNPSMPVTLVSQR